MEERGMEGRKEGKMCVCRGLQLFRSESFISRLCCCLDLCCLSGVRRSEFRGSYFTLDDAHGAWLLVLEKSLLLTGRREQIGRRWETLQTHKDLSMRE